MDCVDSVLFKYSVENVWIEKRNITKNTFVDGRIFSCRILERKLFNVSLVAKVDSDALW